MSLARLNYAVRTEDALNTQINVELNAAHIYLSAASYCLHDSVALPGFHKFFSDMVKDEREDAEKLIKYQAQRGGKVIIGPLQAPGYEWKSLRHVVETALNMEKEVDKSLLSLHNIAQEEKDESLQDFLEGEYLRPQSESIKKFADLVTMVQRVGNEGVGLYLLDRDVEDGRFE